MSHLAILPVLIPLFAGGLLLALVHGDLRIARALSLASVLLQCGAALALLSVAMEGNLVVYRLGDWPAPFGIVLVNDRLSALMLALAAVLALAALIHACGGSDRGGPGFHAMFQLQLMGLNGAFLTGDLFNLFVFFEILLIASFGLLLHNGGPARVRAGLHYVVLNLVGSFLFLMAAGALYGVAGTLNMADLSQRVARMGADALPVAHAAGLLLLGVFGLKAALVPLHFWLAPAYAAAAAPVAALFAIMTKVGIYAAVRVYTLVFDAELIVPWLLPLALVTLAIGSLGLIAGRDLREQIAWLVVVSVGTLLVGIGLFDTAGLGGALYYLVHTTLVTGGLFLLADLAGARREGTRLEPGGRVHQRRWIGTLFLVGAASMSGLPPFSGFVGKLLLLEAGFGSSALPWLWLALLGGGFAALLALSRAGSILFWKSDDAPVVAPPSPWLSLPAAALISAALWLPVLGNPVIAYSEATAGQLLAREQYVAAVLQQGGAQR